MGELKKIGKHGKQQLRLCEQEGTFFIPGLVLLLMYFAGEQEVLGAVPVVSTILLFWLWLGENSDQTMIYGRQR
jgi:hypothetical protein